MSNLETTENKNQIKYDLARTTLELVQFNTALGNQLGSLDVEFRVNGRKQNFSARRLKFLCDSLRIISHEEATITTREPLNPLTTDSGIPARLISRLQNADCVPWSHALQLSTPC